MEGRHQGVDRPVTVIAAAHCIRQKSLGSCQSRGVCRRTQTTSWRHGHVFWLIGANYHVGRHISGNKFSTKRLDLTEFMSKRCMANLFRQVLADDNKSFVRAFIAQLSTTVPISHRFATVYTATIVPLWKPVTTPTKFEYFLKKSPRSRYLKLKIVAAFLPPLPRNANINPHEPA